MITTLPKEKIRSMYMSKYEENKEYVDTRIAEGIEQNRKGNCRIRITDENGIPQANKKIKISQKTHDFKIGANIFLLDEFETDEENAAYRKLFQEHFNLATIPFYWDSLEPEDGKPRFAKDSKKIYRRPAPDLCMEYCEETGVTPKLHCLFYDKWSPDWFVNLDLEAAKSRFEKRIAEIAQRYSGKMFEFEVVNELLEIVYDRKSALGSWKDIAMWCFEKAREYLPDDKLTINETDPIPGLSEREYYSPYYLHCLSLIASGASIDRIGMQNHLFVGHKAKTVEEYDHDIEHGAMYNDPMMYFRALDVIQELGRPLELTEVTVPAFGDSPEDEELQAEMLKLWYSVWFSHAAVDCIVYWNTVDKCTYATEGWNENNSRGGLWHRDMTPKKSAMMLKHLFQEEWHTDLELETDDEGYVEFRGFYGDYLADTGDVQFEFGIHK